MSTADRIEVVGLQALIPADSRHDRPGLWIPERIPNREKVTLTLRHNDHEYYAHLAGTRSEAERLGVFREEGPWTGWAVKVTNTPDPRSGGQLINSVATLEAAILAAMSAVFVLDHMRRERERRLREGRGSADLAGPDQPT